MKTGRFRIMKKYFDSKCGNGLHLFYCSTPVQTRNSTNVFTYSQEQLDRDAIPLNSAHNQRCYVLKRNRRFSKYQNKTEDQSRGLKATFVSQRFVERDDVYGVVRGYVPLIGWLTIGSPPSILGVRGLVLGFFSFFYFWIRA